MKAGETESPMGSYGMTLAEIAALNKKQNLDLVEMVPARNKIPITGDPKHKMLEDIVQGYKVPAVEEKHVYHIILDNPLHDENTGDRIDRGPSVQKFSMAAHDLAQKHGGYMAKKSYILHDPTLSKEPEGVERIFPLELEKAATDKIGSEAQVKAEELATENVILGEELAGKNEEIEKLKQQLLEAEELKAEPTADLEEGEDDLDNLIDELEEGKETAND